MLNSKNDPMRPISDKEKTLFQAMCHAARAGRLQLIRTRIAKTGEQVAAIAALSDDGGFMWPIGHIDLNAPGTYTGTGEANGTADKEATSLKSQIDAILWSN